MSSSFDVFYFIKLYSSSGTIPTRYLIYSYINILMFSRQLYIDPVLLIYPIKKNKMAYYVLRGKNCRIPRVNYSV